MAISKIYEESWRYAYRGIIPQSYLDSIPEGRWASRLTDPGLKALVCIDHGRFVGTSSFGKSRSEQFADQGEIISLYLLPAYMGKGYGKLLLQSAILGSQELGYDTVFLWVLKENLRARQFYERSGFVQTNDHIDDRIGGKDLQEIRYLYRVG